MPARIRWVVSRLSALHRLQTGATLKNFVFQQCASCDLFEYYGFVLADQDAVFDVLADCCCQDHSLQVSAFSNQVFDGVAVVYVDDALRDDWSGVQVVCDVVATCSDDFYAAVEGLVVGFASCEGGEEAVVDVDDTLGVARYEFG